MRKILSVFIVTAAAALTGSKISAAPPTSAAVRALRPGGQPVRPAENPKPPVDAQACVARRSILTTEEKRYEVLKATIVGADAEMAQLQRRMEELRRQKDEAQRSLVSQQQRVKVIAEVYKRDCQANESCELYEQQATQLDTQSDAIEAELGAMSTDISQNRANAGGLEQRIAPLQREYADKRCNNLVPGETEQFVIDRCTAIFSDWNRLQGELNRQNARVPDLKSHYQQLFTELQNLENRATVYQQYLERNCSSSEETAKMREYGQKRQRAQGIGQELDALIAQLTRLKAVKITATAK